MDLHVSTKIKKEREKKRKTQKFCMFVLKADKTYSIDEGSTVAKS